MKRVSTTAVASVLALSICPVVLADSARPDVESEVRVMRHLATSAERGAISSREAGLSEIRQNDPAVVSEVQKRLNERGYDAGPADGEMGAKTRAALSEFQRTQGLEPTGELDQETHAALADMSKGEPMRGAGEGTATEQPGTATGAIEQNGTGVIEEPEPLDTTDLQRSDMQ